MSDNIFRQNIETDDPGMAGGTSYYDIEDLYQAFKARMIKELAARSDELLNDAEIISTNDT